MNMKRIMLLCTALILSAKPAGAVNNSISIEDPRVWPFSWDNAYVYYVNIDRFSNGSRSNDSIFGRKRTDSFGLKTGTFHGGDIAGLSLKLDYIASLGVNVIMITPPVEQVHGIFPGGMGLYGAYAYDGSHALDYTYIDPSFGTINDMRRFIQQAHRRGIRVVMSLELCYPGPPTLRDMCDFGFGKTVLGWEECVPWQPGVGENYSDLPVDLSEDRSWNRWWGSDWLFSGIYGDKCTAVSCLGEDMRFRNTDVMSNKVDLPGFLIYKWDKYANTEYAVPAAAKFRHGSGTVAFFESMWAASWVREFGFDGIAIDNAFSLSEDMLMMLKRNCAQALEDWRALEKSGELAAKWQEPFMLIGMQNKKFPVKLKKDEIKEKLDHLDAFVVPSDRDPSMSSGCVLAQGQDSRMYPYTGKTILIRSLSVPGAHLCRGLYFSQIRKFLLMKEPVMAVYGDETQRKSEQLREFAPELAADSDMNFPRDVDRAKQWAADRFSFSYTLSSNRVLSVWQKIGQFRLRNPAVGGGNSEVHQDGGECRILQKGDYRNAVIIYFGGKSEIEAGSCFKDGDSLRDAMSGRGITVLKGRIPIDDNGMLHLIEKYRRPYIIQGLLN